MTDRVHQVGLPQPDTAIQEERVICVRRRFCDREARGVRETVRVADYESVKGIGGVQVAAGMVGFSLRPGGGHFKLFTLVHQLQAYRLAGSLNQRVGDQRRPIALHERIYKIRIGFNVKDTVPKSDRTQAILDPRCIGNHRHLRLDQLANARP